MSRLFHYRLEHKPEPPVKVIDQLPLDHPNILVRFNAKLALFITKIVGTMWCAYVFAAFDLISLPAAINGGSATIVSWVAQTFLQLVLLSIIMVGQTLQAVAADKRSEQTYKDVETLIDGHNKIQEHLDAQDVEILKITNKEAELHGRERINTSRTIGDWP